MGPPCQTWDPWAEETCQYFARLDLAAPRHHHLHCPSLQMSFPCKSFASQLAPSKCNLQKTVREQRGPCAHTPFISGTLRRVGWGTEGNGSLRECSGVRKGWGER